MNNKIILSAIIIVLLGYIFHSMYNKNTGVIPTGTTKPVTPGGTTPGATTPIGTTKPATPGATTPGATTPIGTTKPVTPGATTPIGTTKPVTPGATTPIGTTKPVTPGGTTPGATTPGTTPVPKLFKDANPSGWEDNYLPSAIALGFYALNSYNIYGISIDPSVLQKALNIKSITITFDPSKFLSFSSSSLTLSDTGSLKNDKGSISMNNNVMTITLNNSTPITPDYHIDWKVSSSVKTNFTVSGITYSS